MVGNWETQILSQVRQRETFRGSSQLAIKKILVRAFRNFSHVSKDCPTDVTCDIFGKDYRLRIMIFSAKTESEMPNK